MFQSLDFLRIHSYEYEFSGSSSLILTQLLKSVTSLIIHLTPFIPFSSMGNPDEYFSLEQFGASSDFIDLSTLEKGRC